MTCPDCKGTGKIALLTTAKPCANCGGTGKLWGKLVQYGTGSDGQIAHVRLQMIAETNAAWEKIWHGLDKAIKDKQ